MSPASKTLHAAFYRSPSGREPVREWLKAEVSAQDRRVIGADIATVEFGWPLGMPVCRPLGEGLREVRSSLSGGRIARVIFCISGDRMVLLSGFIKKSQKTPQHEVDLARQRMKDIMR